MNTPVKIFSPAKNAMQSGRANDNVWVLQVTRTAASLPSADIGWSGSADTNAQVQMNFDSLESARDFASKRGWAYQVIQPKTRKIKPKNYADNFGYARVIPWTH